MLQPTLFSPFLRDGAHCREQEAQIEAVVKQALGDRARLVHVLRRPLPGAATDDAGGGGSGGSALQAFRQRGYVPPARHVTVGALMDAAAAGRLVDVGPPADDARAAAKFRKFWGAKAELRRFQDGKINEAVVWQAGPADRHSIPDQIVRYAAQQHLPAGTRVACCADALDGVLAPKHVEGGAAASVSAGWAADAALDKLSKQLRGLDGLALKVVGVQPLSPASRHTAPFPPLPHPLAGAGGGAASASAEELLGSGRLPRVLEPIEVLVQLEESGAFCCLCVCVCAR